MAKDSGSTFDNQSVQRIGTTVRWVEGQQLTSMPQHRIHRGRPGGGGSVTKLVVLRAITGPAEGFVRVEPVVEGPNYADTMVFTPVSELDTPPTLPTDPPDPLFPYQIDYAVAPHMLAEDYEYAIWPAIVPPVLLTLETEILEVERIQGRWRVKQTVRMMIRKIAESVQHGSCRLGVP